MKRFWSIINICCEGRWALNVVRGVKRNVSRGGNGSVGEGRSIRWFVLERLIERWGDLERERWKVSEGELCVCGEGVCSGGQRRTLGRAERRGVVCVRVACSGLSWQWPMRCVNSATAYPRIWLPRTPRTIGVISVKHWDQSILDNIGAFI